MGVGAQVDILQVKDANVLTALQAIGSRGDAPATTPSADQSLVSLLKGLLQSFTSYVENSEGVALSSAARSTGGWGTAIEVFTGTVLRLFLDVTAASGTNAALDVWIEAYDPASGQWVEVERFPTMYSVGRYQLIKWASTRFRVAWSVSGTTPSFTFSVGYNVLVG